MKCAVQVLLNNLHEVAFEPPHIYLCFRVVKSRITFKRSRPFLREYDAGKDRPAVLRSILEATGVKRNNDLIDDCREFSAGNRRVRRNGAGTTSEHIVFAIIHMFVVFA